MEECFLDNIPVKSMSVPPFSRLERMSQSQIKDVMNKSKVFVSKWYRKDLLDPKDFYVEPQKGAPVTTQLHSIN